MFHVIYWSIRVSVPLILVATLVFAVDTTFGNTTNGFILALCAFLGAITMHVGLAVGYYLAHIYRNSNGGRAYDMFIEYKQGEKDE